MHCFLQLALWHCFGSAAGGHMLKWSTETGLDPGKYRKTFKWMKRLSDHFQLFGPNLRLWHGWTGNYDALLNANPVPDDFQQQLQFLEPKNTSSSWQRVCLTGAVLGLSCMHTLLTPALFLASASCSIFSFSRKFQRSTTNARRTTSRSM